VRCSGGGGGRVAEKMAIQEDFPGDGPSASGHQGMEEEPE
jgi:hypothetical protein